MDGLTRAAALLDRDGTLNRRPPDHHYVTEAGEFELLPGTIDGLARLAGCGNALIVVSNQRGIERGLVSEEALRATEAILQRELEPRGARVEGFYYCPHLIERGCDCRKPKPGLLLRAAEELGLDLGASWMIGDSPSDVEAGRAAGCRTALIGGDPADAGADLDAATLTEAAAAICARGR